MMFIDGKVYELLIVCNVADCSGKGQVHNCDESDTESVVM